MDSMDDADATPDAFSELPRYTGSKMTCATCEHHFRHGDLVMFSAQEDLLFCPVFEDAISESCHIRWVFENRQALCTTAMLFYGSSSQ